MTTWNCDFCGEIIETEEDLLCVSLNGEEFDCCQTCLDVIWATQENKNLRAKGEPPFPAQPEKEKK